ncbi:MAG TPA: vWA domain-containing protein [Fimbriimonadaceae bacterium]|nr:vWA domain-containing protein [Fimbriimonadaceae bacterium]
MQIIAIAAAAVQLALGAGPSLRTQAPKIHNASTDVVFMIVVSGSMRRLIDEAKNLMYEVGSAYRASSPRGTLRVGFLIYGNGSKEIDRLDLTTDLGKAEQYLSAVQSLTVYQEYVPEFLEKAVKTFQWDPFASKNLIAVGNEIPQQGNKMLLAAVDEARRLDVMTSAIWCNMYSRDRQSQRELSVAVMERLKWQEIAQVGGGFFLEVNINAIRERQAREAQHREFQKRLQEATVAAHRRQLASLTRRR